MHADELSGSLRATQILDNVPPGQMVDTITLVHDECHRRRTVMTTDGAYAGPHAHGHHARSAQHMHPAHE